MDDELYKKKSPFLETVLKGNIVVPKEIFDKNANHEQITELFKINNYLSDLTDNLEQLSQKITDFIGDIKYYRYTDFDNEGTPENIKIIENELHDKIKDLTPKERFE